MNILLNLVKPLHECNNDIHKPQSMLIESYPLQPYNTLICKVPCVINIIILGHHCILHPGFWVGTVLLYVERNVSAAGDTYRITQIICGLYFRSWRKKIAVYNVYISRCRWSPILYYIYSLYLLIIYVLKVFGTIGTI